MAKRTRITNQSKGLALLDSAQWCDTYLSKLRGRMFTAGIDEADGLVLVEKRDSRVATSIHMLFVPYELGVIWVNSAGLVVDKRIAKPWALSYAPKAPARYTIELHPDRLARVEIDDRIEFSEI